MRSPSLSAISLAVAVSLASPALAHFQELIPSADVLPEGGTITLDLTFTHPFEMGPVMEMKKPVRMGVLKNGQVMDLLQRLVEQPVGGMTAWTVSDDLPEPGAAIYFVEPEPYWEPAEQKYIVHYAKVVVDSWASGEGWDQLVGLPVEIEPLTRPTGVWAGNIFSGVVLRNGQPVAFAEIEVEFVNDGVIAAPNDAFITQVIKANASGTFSYAMPRAGWWGFAALIEGDEPMAAPDGTMVPVETGALFWVKATAMDIH
jgi:cobalt/nickel transport protein